MTKKKEQVRFRTLTPEEFAAKFRPGLFAKLRERNKTMGPFEADPSPNTP